MNQRLERFGILCAGTVGLLTAMFGSIYLGVLIFLLLGVLIVLRNRNMGPPVARV